MYIFLEFILYVYRMGICSGVRSRGRHEPRSKRGGKDRGGENEGVGENSIGSGQ